MMKHQHILVDFKPVTLEKVRNEIQKIIKQEHQTINPTGTFNSLCEFILSERLDGKFSEIKSNAKPVSKKQMAIDSLKSYANFSFFPQWRNNRLQAKALIQQLEQAHEEDVERMIEKHPRKDISNPNGGFSRTLAKIQLQCI